MSGECRCCGGRCGDAEPVDLSRREFLGKLTAGAAGLALAGELAWADSAGHAAPLAPPAAGTRKYPLTPARVYKEKNLEAVSMPIGGIGTGSIWLDGQGRLAIWQIFNNLNEPRIPDSFFAVRARAGQEKAVVRVLQTAEEQSLPPMASLEYEGGYRKGFVRQLEIDYVHPDGKIVPIDINATCLDAGDGRRIVCLCRDITERRQAKEARFLNPDAINILGGSCNLYSYVGNSATNGVDPEGTYFLAGAVVGGVLNGGIAGSAYWMGNDSPNGWGLGYAVLSGAISGAVAGSGVGAAWQVATAVVLGSANFFVSGGGTSSQFVASVGWATFSQIVPEKYFGFKGPWVANRAKIVTALKPWTKTGFVLWENSLFGQIVSDQIDLYFQARASTLQVASHDPNDMLGLAGYGTSHFVSADPALPYTIRFENDSSATASAASVLITQQLDPLLDPNTFELGDFGFGGITVEVPAGLTSYNTRMDLTSTLGVYVDVSAAIDLESGLATWTFTSIDPTTGDLPLDPFTGFLPPNQTPPEGDGFVTYTVRPKATVATGDQVDSAADIVFDWNPSMVTPALFNTIDAGTPTSTVAALPATTTTLDFLVNWDGQDDPGGSGVASYYVYVKEDDEPWTAWQTATTSTSATFTGQGGHTYAFYSIATDNVGHVEAAPPDADAATTLILRNLDADGNGTADALSDGILILRYLFDVNAGGKPWRRTGPA